MSWSHSSASVFRSPLNLGDSRSPSPGVTPMVMRYAVGVASSVATALAAYVGVVAVVSVGWSVATFATTVTAAGGAVSLFPVGASTWCSAMPPVAWSSLAPSYIYFPNRSDCQSQSIGSYNALVVQRVLTGSRCCSIRPFLYRGSRGELHIWAVLVFGKVCHCNKCLRTILIHVNCTFIAHVMLSTSRIHTKTVRSHAQF